MKRRILSLLLAVILCVGSLSTAAFASDESEATTPVYIAIGDSITSGYGLEDATTQAFPVLLGTSLGAITTNNGTDGLTSTTLLAALQTTAYDTVIASADVITLTIGGNDMMNALYAYLVSAYNLANDPDITVTQLQAVLADPTSASNMSIATSILALLTQMDELTLASALSEALDTYSNNLTAIITYLRTCNPTAVILVATQYNPYQWLGDSYASIIALFESGVTSLNTVIKTGALATGAYTVADVAAAFSESEDNLCNASVSFSLAGMSLNLDFHPNAAGHQVIADTMYAAYLAATVTPADIYYYGDVNLDGNVGTDDALAILEHYVKLTLLDESNDLIMALANADREGIIDSGDALYCLKVVVKLNNPEEYVPDTADETDASEDAEEPVEATSPEGSEDTAGTTPDLSL